MKKKTTVPVESTRSVEPKYEAPKFATQDFIPLKDVLGGIIETTDGRYLKILEIEPINFNLLSDDEKYNVVVAFMRWLKISPINLQFKAITTKADTRKYVKTLRKELAAEENAACKAMGEDYIRLINDVSAKEALTRRFFLIMECPGYYGMSEGEALSKLNTAIAEARLYFGMCGNHFVEAENENFQQMEILYQYFNRRTSADEDFNKRFNRIYNDCQAAQHVEKGGKVDLDLAASVAPKGLDFSYPEYYIMDGRYYTTMYIAGKSIPGTVHAGWLGEICNLGEGIDVDIFFQKMDRNKVINDVTHKTRLNNVKLRDTKDTSIAYDTVASAVNSGYFIKYGIANNNEDLWKMSILITISADKLASLDWLREQVISYLTARDMDVSKCRFRQEQAFGSVMPFCDLDKQLAKKTSRNVLTSGAAASYMLTAFEMSDDGGVMLGTNKYNNSLVILDLFNTDKHKSANMVLMGSSGSGKTFTMSLLALRYRMRGVQSIILTPIKGFEFKRSCKSIGGQYVEISSASKQSINIMEIRNTLSPEIALLDAEDIDDASSLLGKKALQIETFLGLLIPDITTSEEQLLDLAVIDCYKGFGISFDNRSVYVNGELNGEVKPMPILGDLQKALAKLEGTERLIGALEQFVSGSAQSFNKQTNVDLSNKFIVLDLSALKGRLLPAGMFVALDYVYDECNRDRTKKKAIFIDEVWQLIGSGASRLAAEYTLNLFKTIRGIGGAAIAATQDLDDFFGLDNGKYGRAILNNSPTKLVLNLEADGAERVREVLRLNGSEITQIRQFSRGEGLLLSENTKVAIKIKASPLETELITTDREQLRQQIERKLEERNQ